MSVLKGSTLVFLIRGTRGGAMEVCLAMKKRGFGAGKWNGVGGKIEPEDESVEDAARRETAEEIGVTLLHMKKIAEIAFTYMHQPNADQIMHVYCANQWKGEPRESAEMKPQWFAFGDIPFRRMWPDDIYWLPQVLQGHCVRAAFRFASEDAILAQTVRIVDTFEYGNNG